MDVGLYRMVAAMRTNQQRVEIVASNIANAETGGFKRMLHVAHGSSNWGNDANHEQVVTSSTLDLSQGILQHTGETFDIALEGPGFFVVEGDDGEVMTRAGAFQLDDQGNLLSAEGQPVAWEGARGRIDPIGATVRINQIGEVIQGGTTLGRLRIVGVDDPTDLEIDSEGRYRLRAGADYGTPEAIVHQGFVERANVQTVDELVEMIAAQRSFEMASQTFRLISESYQRLHR